MKDNCFVLCLITLTLMVANVNQGFAQKSIIAQKSANEIIFTSNQVTFPFQHRIAEYTIGVLDDKSNIYNELKQLNPTQLIHAKPFKVLLFNKVTDVIRTDILFVNQNANMDLELLESKFERYRPLLIGNGLPFDSTMINFLLWDNRTFYEVNLVLMEAMGYEITHKVFREAAITSSGSWRDYARRLTDFLEITTGENKSLKTMSEISNRLISSQSFEIEKLNDKIDEQKQYLLSEQQKNTIQQQRFDSLCNLVILKQDEANHNSKMVDNQNNTLTKQRTRIDEQLAEITQIKLSLKRYNSLLDNQKAKYVEQKAKIEQQNKQLETQSKKIVLQTIGLIVFVIFLLISATIMFFIFRENRIRRVINAELAEKNQAILEQKEEMVIQKEQLERSNIELEKLSVVVREMSNSVLIFDATGVLEWVNEGFTRIMGYADKDEFIAATGRSTLWAISTNPDMEQLAHDCIISRTSAVYQSEGLTKDQQKIWFQTTFTPIFDSTGRLRRLVAIDTDITKLVQAEKALQKQKEETEQAKMAAIDANMAKSRFLANMSHEIRTPLNSVLGFADLLATLVIDKQQKSYINAIRSSGRNLLTIINDILDFSKIEAGKLILQYDTVSISTMVDELKQMFALTINEKSLNFIVNLDPKLPRNLLLDEVRIRQILVNLIGNAIKFTDMGSIRLEVKVESISHDKTDLIIEVADTGHGIEPEFQQSIFESFSQKSGQDNKKFGGTGLGLSISKGLVELMNGKLYLNSTIGKGTTFTIFIREVVIAGFAGESKMLDNTAGINKKFVQKTVIIVDDIAENRNLIMAFLANTNLQLIEAENGSRAVSLAQAYQPAAIVMDIFMPVMSGYEALKILRSDEKLCVIPVIAITASAVLEEQTKIRESGFNDLLVKPVLRGDLIAVLSKYIPSQNIDAENDALFIKYGVPAIEKHLHNIKFDNLFYNFDDDLINLWKNVSHNNSINEIREFGAKIIIFARQFNIPYFEDYGSQLVTCANNFDIEQLNLHIKFFPQLLINTKNVIFK